MKVPSILLASTSPRRRQLLDALGLKFRVSQPKDEEIDADATNVSEIVLSNAEKKARAVLFEIKENQEIALGADTLVLLGDQVLSKPKDKEDGRKMLHLLSGNTQTVFTGVCLFDSKNKKVGRVVKSEVIFKKLTLSQIEDYLNTREPYDRAGAYAIQGLGALFIERIEGSYTNVVGLPIEAVMELMQELTGISIFEWFR